MLSVTPLTLRKREGSGMLNQTISSNLNGTKNATHFAVPAILLDIALFVLEEQDPTFC